MPSKTSPIPLGVIISTYNRPKPLHALLTSIQNTNYPHTHLEIIICDDHVSKNALPVYQSVNKIFPNIHYLSCKNQGPSHARNRGLQRASHKWVCFFDDDITVDKNYFQVLTKTIEQYDTTALIGGQNQLTLSHPKARKRIKQFSDFAWVFAHTVFSYKTPTFLQYDGQTLFSSNMCLNSHYFKDNTVFKEELLGKKYPLFTLFGEDHELCLRCQLEHKQILYVPNLKCAHHVDPARYCYSYIFKRIFLSGIEQYLIDQLYKHHKNYHLYSYKPRSGTVIKKAADATISAGYNLAKTAVSLGFLNQPQPKLSRK